MENSSNENYDQEIIDLLKKGIRINYITFLLIFFILLGVFLGVYGYVKTNSFYVWFLVILWTNYIINNFRISRIDRKIKLLKSLKDKE
jgi:hypothetical protein